MSLLLPVLQLSFDSFRAFFEEATTTEGRLAVSGIVLFVTVLVSLLVAPYLIRQTTGLVRSRVFPEGSVNAFDVLMEYFPTTVGTLLVRLVQLSLFFLAVVTLLIVWGLVDVAISVVTYVAQSLPFLGTLGLTLLLFFLAYVAVDVYGKFVRQLVDETNRVTDHQQEIMLRMGHVGILAFVIFGVLTLWGADLSGLLVGAGFLGIVVGLAARQTLGSMIAGFVLMFSRPFTIGDWVQVGDDEGFVTDITIMNTRLQSVDGESIVIPNDKVNNQSITNRSEQGHLRIRVDVGVDYETDTEHAQELALDTLMDLDAVTDTPPPQVVPKAFADSAILLELRFWISNPTPQHRWHATEEVIHAIKSAFDREGIKIPYPQRELTGRAETGGFSVRQSDSDGSRADTVESPARTIADNGAQTNGGDGSDSEASDRSEDGAATETED